MRLHPPIVPRLLRDFLAFRAHVARTRAAAWTSIPPEWDLLPAYYNGNHLNIVGTGDAIPPMRFETFEGGSPKIVQSSKMDYEAEIGFVLGQGGRDILAARAAEHLFGVTIFNDFSARDIQMAAGKIGMGPAPGKDWANALGPCIVTRDEFGELRDQSVVVRVNNEERLRDHYRTMVFPVPEAGRSRGNRDRRDRNPSELDWPCGLSGRCDRRLASLDWSGRDGTKRIEVRTAAVGPARSAR